MAEQKKETKTEKKLEDKEKTKEEFREYIIPLRKSTSKVPRYKRASKAIKTIKEFLIKHMKVYDRDLNKIKLDKYLNEFVWQRGIKNPPAKIKIKVIKDGEIIKAELSEIPQEFIFKKQKLERREQKVSEPSKKTKEKIEEKTPQVAEEEKEEQKAQIEEKKISSLESTQKLEKEIAKKTKHQTKIPTGPKRQRRMALEK